MLKKVIKKIIKFLLTMHKFLCNEALLHKKLCSEALLHYFLCNEGGLQKGKDRIEFG